MTKPKRPTQAMYAAIGRTAAESAAVDNKFREILSHMIGSPFGQVLMAGEDISRLVSSCLRVARYSPQLSEEELKDFFGICRAVEQLRGHRNFLVHAEWHKLQTPGEHLGTRSSRPSDAKSEKTGQGTHEVFVWTVKDAELVADNYAKLAGAMDAFIERAFPGQYVRPLMSRADSAKLTAAWTTMLGSAAGSLAGDVAADAAPSRPSTAS